MKTKLLIIVFLSLMILLSAKGNCFSKKLTVPAFTKDTIALNENGNFKNQQLKPIKTIKAALNKPIQPVYLAAPYGTRYVYGIVIADEDKSLLSGVAIVVKDTVIGTVSNDKGQFYLEVPQGFNTLIISYIGFATKELKLTDLVFYKVILVRRLIFWK